MPRSASTASGWRTEIFEGNRQDVTTLEDVIGSLEKDMPEGSRHLIVMDAGFSSSANLQWLRDNGYDFITVMRSSGAKYTTEGPIRTVTDNKEQQMRLQMAKVDGIDDTVLLVDRRCDKSPSQPRRPCVLGSLNDKVPSQAEGHKGALG